MDRQFPKIGQSLPSLKSIEDAAKQFARHPELRMLDKEMAVTHSGVELSQQGYK